MEEEAADKFLGGGSPVWNLRYVINPGLEGPLAVLAAAKRWLEMASRGYGELVSEGIEEREGWGKGGLGGRAEAIGG